MPAVEAENFTFLTKMLRMFFALIGYVQPVGLFQWSLFVGVHVDATLHTLLSHISPTIAGHPSAFTLETSVFAETSLFTLIGCETFALWSSLGAILDVMSFFETQMAQVRGRWPLGGFPIQEIEFRKTFRKITDTLGQASTYRSDTVQSAPS